MVLVPFWNKKIESVKGRKCDRKLWHKLDLKCEAYHICFKLKMLTLIFKMAGALLMRKLLFIKILVG